MLKNYTIAAGCVTIGEFKELIADLPNNYILRVAGMDDGYINVIGTEQTVVIDTECDYMDEYKEAK